MLLLSIESKFSFSPIFCSVFLLPRTASFYIIWSTAATLTLSENCTGVFKASSDSFGGAEIVQSPPTLFLFSASLPSWCGLESLKSLPLVPFSHLNLSTVIFSTRILWPSAILSTVASFKSFKSLFPKLAVWDPDEALRLFHGKQIFLSQAVTRHDYTTVILEHDFRLCIRCTSQ